jgi:hypothetical protein
VKDLLPRARGRASPTPTAGAARGSTGPLPGGRGGPGPPEAGWSGQARDGLAITRGGPGPPWEVRVREGYPRALLRSWGCGGPGPVRARGWSGDHGPSCQAQTVCHVTRRAKGRLRITYCLLGGHPVRRLSDGLLRSPVRRQRDAKNLYTLAGATPVRMYRQRPSGPPRVRDEPAGGARSQHCAGWTACSHRGRARMSFPP